MFANVNFHIQRRGSASCHHMEHIMQNATKQNANVTIVPFTRSKTVRATEATPKQDALYLMGEDLGHAAADSHVAWVDALKCVKTPADRSMLRAGFRSAYCAALGKSEAQADQRFSYLARLHAAPETSRKHASTKAKKGKGGRPEKTESGKGEKLSEKDVAARLVKALAYVSKAQAKHAGDGEMLEVLGEIAAILGGK
jgi:hypothetical protein